MNDTASPHGEEESFPHVGKTEYRKDGPETQAQLSVDRVNSTYSVGEKQPSGSFNKYFDLGAHNIMHSDLFCINTRLLNAILRDSTYGGRYYGTSGLLAKELGIDMQDTRKRLKAMEGADLLMRMQAENGGRYILLNPHFFCAGGPEDEVTAKRLWAREKDRRIKEARKRGP